MTAKYKIIIISALAVVLAAAITVTCLFGFPTFTVTFDSNGGSAVEPITKVRPNSKITAPVHPQKLDFDFDGWYLDGNFSKAWIFSKNEVTSDVTLYAKWKQSYNEGLQFVLNNDVYSVSRGTAVDSEIVIPHFYKGKKVTALGTQAFINCEFIKKVTLADNLEKIGSHAFMGCKGLEKVVLPNSVTSLEAFAFSTCSNLAEIELSSALKTVGNSAFANCKKLNKLSLPDGVEKIGTYAISNCESLKNVVLPTALTEISAWTFSGCKSLENVTIGAKVSSIGIDAFNNCNSLAKLTYLGTREEWNKISKIDGWKGNCPVATVVCSDGEISL